MPPVEQPAGVVRPRPLTSLVASAKRITSRTTTNTSIRSGSATRTFADDAWEMFDLVGEERFLSTTLAGRLAQAHFFIGKLSDDPTEDPQPVTDDAQITELLNSIGTNPANRAQMVNRLGVNLFVAGDGWLVGIPRDLFPDSLLPTPSLDVEPPGRATRNLEPVDDRTDDPDNPTLVVTELEWRMLSSSEVTSNAPDEVTLALGNDDGEKITCHPEDVWLVKVWRPHPRRSWESDSPTRSSLPVLREIVGLTMHISAQVDSRLAGAGLLLVPQSASQAIKAAAGKDPDDDSDEFTEALMEAMLTPIADRANASALVPLVVTVPDEATSAFNYLTFAKPLDTEARALRDEAIRRLALGQDAPPELLLGVGGMNHWGAWLVREDVVTTHLEPPLALMCDAITTQFVWPVLADLGRTDFRDYVFWYDVSHMIMRPNRAADAKDLHSSGVLSDTSLRDATGFGDSDAPPETTSTPIEVTLAVELCKANPGLFGDPGLPMVAAQIKAALEGDLPVYVPEQATATPAVAVEEPTQAKPDLPPVEEELPSADLPGTDEADPTEPGLPIAASAADLDAWAALTTGQLVSDTYAHQHPHWRAHQPELPYGD